MVFYRKYRPQKIDDLDSVRMRETLYSVLSKDPPHAFLFTGPKGLGKTSTARIVAKVVNCNKKPQLKTQNLNSVDNIEQLEPCNKCEQCKSITAGNNLDVVEIDAASNRGIDEIRDLREKIWLAPLKASKKVYIIDEVHMLTTEAFNAMLKIIEEPPDHAIFILCTTEPQKVPATIINRCFHITFKKATEDELIRSLKRIVKGENISFKEGQEVKILKSIAKMSEGGFRDAAKILEEVSLLGKGRELTEDLIESIYKTSTSDVFTSELLTALKKNDSKISLELINKITDQGVDLKHFISSVLENLHEQLLEEVEVKEKSRNRTYAFSITEIKLLTEIFSKAYSEMKYSVLPILPLELAVIEYISDNKIGGKSDDRKPEEITISELRKQANGKIKQQAIQGDEKKVKKTETEIKSIKPDVELLNVPANGEITKEWMNALWKGVIEEMKKHNHTVAGVLRSCTLKSYDKKLMIIETAYKFHKERLDDNKARLGLMSVCKMLTGNNVEIEVELKKRG